MDASQVLETIALLIEQAERGEIDPWDVQVIDVIDRYLSKLVPPAQATPGAYDTDLSQSGQAFLSASMLVLFKANTLMSLQATEDEMEVGEEDLLPLGAESLTHQARLPLERQLRRRPAAMPPPKRRVTLPELIEQLQLMATKLQLAEQAAKTSRPRRLSQPHGQALRAALELAHQENLTEVAGELEQLLITCTNQLHLTQNWLDLDHLVELWTQTKPTLDKDTSVASHAHDRVGVFWALLLLSSQSKVELSQEEFYQDLQIRLLVPPATNQTES